MDARDRLKKAECVVVKVGTSTITYPNGKMHLKRIDHLVREISDLKNQGYKILLVSSGAIATGMNHIGMSKKPDDIPERQALAAIGQGVLLHIYEKFFAEYGQTAAQVLLTRDNYTNHSQYSRSRDALRALLSMDVVPIINENDAVSVDELKIGDNDNLSAIVASLVDADVLIILSDIDGVYTDNPQKNSDACLIGEIDEITPEVERLAGGAGSGLGTGGMMTKIQAAKIAMNSGATMVIAPGNRENVISDVLSGENIGTIFPARESHLRSRKRWLAFGKRIMGDIVVDSGCEQAMRTGSSILPAGVVSVGGVFPKGSTIRVLSEMKQEIARGIVNYDSESLSKIMGKHTDEIKGLIDGDVYDEVIHRDNMVLMV